LSLRTDQVGQYLFLGRTKKIQPGNPSSNEDNGIFEAGIFDMSLGQHGPGTPVKTTKLFLNKMQSREEGGGSPAGISGAFGLKNQNSLLC